MLTKEEKTAIMKEYARAEGDTVLQKYKSLY